MEKKELQYKTYNDKVYFYYGENLIFQSGKSIPFIVLKKIKNDVKTSTSLYKHKINKTDDGYEIEFSSERNKAVVKLTQKENAVNFEIKCDDEYDELCFTLYKRKDYKIYGLPTYEAKEIKRTFREKLLRKKPQIINPERKLSFYVSETYYFENINITEYSYEIKDNIYITTGTKNPEFRLIYAKNIYAAINTTEKNNPKIKKYNTGTCFLRTEKYNEKEIAEYCKEKGLKIDGIIIEKRILGRDFCAGGYFFEDSELFCKIFDDLKNYKPLYMSHIVYKALLDGHSFRPTKVNNYKDWGTLKDWRENE